jgi:hypothetical protein
MSELETLLGSDRAEDLTPDQVVSTFSGVGDENIVSRLMSSGALLLQGSRGTGKTMLLRVAYERVRRERPVILPVFVSFTTYLSIYNANSRPIENYSPFQHWVLAKLLAGVRGEIESCGKDMSDLKVFGPIPLDGYIEQLEKHYLDTSIAEPAKNAKILGVSESDLLAFARLDGLQSRVLSILDHFGFESVTFFLDEAAQSFAEEFQPEFFQLMKHLRHHRISVKAAVYPNTTNYGRDFDVGHDAIIIPIEREIETEEGMDFFRDFMKKRFLDTRLGEALRASEAQSNFLVKMSGGNPRWFIHLLNRLNQSEAGPIPSTKCLAVAKELPDNTLWPYLQKLRARLRSKRKYVDAATSLAQTFIEGLKEANKSVRRDAPERVVCYVAVSTHKTLPFRIHAALKILQYAGIIFGRGPKKITGRETAEMYLVHPAILVRENALFGGETNVPLESIVAALTDPPRERMREYTRNSPKLLDFRQDDEPETISCPQCGTELPENARFCLNCGRGIEQGSPYAELLERPATELELTPGIKQWVIADGRFKTVGDIKTATDAELDSIHMIGKTRILSIRYAAEEFLAG